MNETVKLLPENLIQTEIKNDIGATIQHVFDKESIDAINAALAIKRPLLIWGEPGIGKSQLAKAVAKVLKRVFIPFVADSQTESRDLLWHFDAVARLAEAQIQQPGNVDKEALAIEKFIIPRALWWALNWESAEKLITIKTDGKKDKTYRHMPPAYSDDCNPENGSVVLIDEIDKADTNVPNGLLQALGSNCFHPLGLDRAVEAEGEAPLVLITTNDNHKLPDPFLRRCLSLHLKFPKTEKEQREFLVKRGKVNFPKLTKPISELASDEEPNNVLNNAAKLLIEDRRYAKENHLYPLCGQAEYFDLLRGIDELIEQQRGSTEELIQSIRKYTYQKHPDFPRAEKG